MMQAYLYMIRIRFMMMMAYRVQYYSGIIIYSINIGAYYFLWSAIYGGNESVAGMSMTQMTTYVAVSWMARAFYFNNLDREIATEIRDGSVAIQFIRPYQYILVKFSQAFGEGMFRLFLFSVPGMIIVSFLFPVQLPTDVGIWLVFVVMLMFSFLINTQINMITGLFAFYIENNEGLMRMKRVLVDLCSGLIIPLTFFPDWAANVLQWLPFQAITYLPSSVFTGRTDGSAILTVLGIQLLWFIILTIPVVVLWVKARRRLFVQGG